MPKRKALFCDAGWDSVTCPAHAARVDNANNHRFILPPDVEPIRLSHEAANSKNVADLIPEAPVLFSGSGHGTADSFKGYRNQIILDAYSLSDGKANPIARGAVVHLFACLCGQPGSGYLADHLVRIVGAKAFIGYSFPLYTSAFSDADLPVVMLPDCMIDQWVLEGVPAAEIKSRVDAMVPRQREQLRADEVEEFVAYDLIYPHLVGPWDRTDNYGRL